MPSDTNSQPPSGAPRHPIGVVAERTGLSQDVLRMWERRYGAVQPVRSLGGERLYTDADIERLWLMHAAVAAGRRIGMVARLPVSELAQLVDEDLAAGRQRVALEAAPGRERETAVVERVLARVHALDSSGLDELLRRTAAVVGAPTFLEHVAAPVLRRIGDDWHAGRLTIAEEHLASAVIDGFISEMMRSMAREDEAPRLLVATPAGSRHVIGAALVGAAAAAEGWSVIYLGGDLPASEIARAAITSDAGAVALSVVYAEDAERMLGELHALRERLPEDVPLLAGGAALLPHARKLVAAGIEFGESLDAVRQLLRRLGTSSPS